MKTTTLQFSARTAKGLKILITCCTAFLVLVSYGQSGLNEFHSPDKTEDSLTVGSNSNSSYLYYSLLGFDVKNHEQDALIEWSTHYETEHVLFNVERSIDLTNWDVVYHGQGVGVSTCLTAYTFTDQNPLTGTSYYRLKIVDINGVINHSLTKSFFMNNTQSPALMAYPNPANSYLIVSGTVSDLANLTIHDISGQDVSASVELMWEDPNQVGMDISNLGKGHYYFSTPTNFVKIAKL